jgi:hypothetical protein
MLTFGFLLYAIIGMATMCKSSAARGESDSHSSTSSYMPEDFFGPLVAGTVWPIYLCTYGAYRYGFNRSKQLMADNDKALKRMRELAPHMDDIEKYLASRST